MLLLVHFLLLLQQWPIFAKNEDCWTSGACLQSVMIDQTASEDPLTCENFCKSKPDCSWFSYYGDQGLCVALTECRKLTDIPRTLSGQSKCGNPPECNQIGRCTGILIGVSKAETPEACLTLCQSRKDPDSTCEWFTHDSFSNGCYLFKDCVALSPDCRTCVSGQASCSSRSESVRIITGGGMPYTNAEISPGNYFIGIDLSELLINEVLIPCEPLPEFPVGIRGAVSVSAMAELDYEVPMICGGHQYEHITNECWGYYYTGINPLNYSTPSSRSSRYFNGSVSSWESISPMLEARAFAASVKVLEAGMTSEYNWWVSGGLDLEMKPLKSSEIRWLNGSWTAGPQLPQATHGHCVVQIQRQKSVLIGDGGNFIFDWTTWEWSSFPAMQTPRYYHGCGLLRNTILGSEYAHDIVVLGGLTDLSDSSLALNSAEIYRSDLGQWTAGPDFPTSIFGMAMVQYSSDVIIAIGGNANGEGASSSIYSLSKSDLSSWRLLGGTAPLVRQAHVAVVVPENTFFCVGDPVEDPDDPMLADEELIEEFTLVED